MLAAYVVETVGPQDYTFTAEQFLGRLDTSYGGDAAEVGPPAPDRLGGSAEAPHHVARHAVVGELLADVLLPAHPAPRRHVDGRGRVGRATATTVWPTATSPIRFASSMTGSGQSIPRQSSSSRLQQAESSARSGVPRRSGSTARKRVHVRRRWRRGSARPARCRGSARPSRRARGWARGVRRGAGRAARRPRSPRRSSSRRPAPRRRRRGTRRSPGGGAGRPGRRPPRCPGCAATPARIRSTSACWRASTSSRSATTAWSAAAAASAAGTFSNPATRSSTRSSAGKGLRQRAPLRTSSTPTPAGPPHLWAEPAAAPSPSGSGSRPIEAQASTNSGTSPAAPRPPRRPAERADLVVGRLHGGDATSGGAAAARRERRPARPVRRPTGTSTVAAPGHRARAAPRSARRRSARDRSAPGRRRSPSRPRCTASVPGRGEGHLVAAVRRAPRRPPRGRCRAAAGRRGRARAAGAGRRTRGRARRAAPRGRPGAAARRTRRRGTRARNIAPRGLPAGDTPTSGHLPQPPWVAVQLVCP